MGTTLHAQIKKLEADANLIYTIRSTAKTTGGRLTTCGNDLVFTLLKNGVKQSEIAKILDVTPSAIAQQAAKFKI